MVNTYEKLASGYYDFNLRGEQTYMDFRTAYKMVIKNELENLIDENRLSLDSEKLEALVNVLHEDEEFLRNLNNKIEEYLVDFGDNYEL
ncbi:hypothetical protein [Paenibacillus ferrarius]|nr:hypothetical protein [Paenibacillus ferrarius]